MEHTVKTPGVVTGLSVAAIVAAPVPENQIDAIRRSIGAAVGINPDRGAVIVEAMGCTRVEEEGGDSVIDESLEPASERR